MYDKISKVILNGICLRYHILNLSETAKFAHGVNTNNIYIRPVILFSSSVSNKTFLHYFFYRNFIFEYSTRRTMSAATCSSLLLARSIPISCSVSGRFICSLLVPLLHSIADSRCTMSSDTCSSLWPPRSNQVGLLTSRS